MVSLASLFYLFSFIGATYGFMDNFHYWSDAYLKRKVSIRMVKKEWRPYGPSNTTDEVLDEYRWDADTAYESLSKSDYEYFIAPLPEAERLFYIRGEYDKTKESIILIHPIFSTADLLFVKTTIIALGMRNLHRKYNVFAINMPVLNFNMILTVMKNAFYLPTKYENIAEVVSQFLVKAINQKYLRPSQIHLVGYSYSAHLVGYIARYLDFIYEQKVNTVVSLDPYTNGFNFNLMHVSSEDAEVVHVYHTNSALAGTRERIGTADFVFNNGVLMPECTGWKLLKNPVPEPMICSHLKVVHRFRYLILYPSRFVGRRCDTWNRMAACVCEDHPTVTLSYPITDKTIRGTYFMRTLGTRPYGVGQWGADCTSESRLQRKEKRSYVRKKLGVPDLRELFGDTSPMPSATPDTQAPSTTTTPKVPSEKKEDNTLTSDVISE